MRYKVTALNPAAYQDVVKFLHGRGIPVLLESEKRRFLAVGDLPDADFREIAAKGAEITPDFQYDLEAKI
ncbi:MAG TPA: hypothetical protein VGS07_12400 [Thermoanaerobaculia bacterium]|jgi:hypothetical protein|nr:hypothetical protein [Thermoanaerobaculia bacterium]